MKTVDREAKDDVGVHPPVRTVVGRLAVALVWFYEGLWCKVLAVSAEHRSVLSSVPGLARQADLLLMEIGLLETALGIWVLSGYRPQSAALVQIILLSVMNIAGLLFGYKVIHNPFGMIIHNAAFLTLIWMVGNASRKEEPCSLTALRGHQDD